MDEVNRMLDRAVTTVKELFLLYTICLRLADKVILEGDSSPNWVANYKAARANLDAYKGNLKK